MLMPLHHLFAISILPFFNFAIKAEKRSLVTTKKHKLVHKLWTETVHNFTCTWVNAFCLNNLTFYKMWELSMQLTQPTTTGICKTSNTLYFAIVFIKYITSMWDSDVGPCCWSVKTMFWVKLVPYGNTESMYRNSTTLRCDDETWWESFEKLVFITLRRRWQCLVVDW